MAPKSKKLRQSRMHAAIDAMRPFGFSPKIVQAKVRTLLKEYGGEDCWPFIESDAYSLLITSILEEQDEEKEDKSFVGENLVEAKADIGIQSNASGESDVGPSELVLSPVGSEIVDTASHTMQTVFKVKEEPSHTNVLETTPIISLPPNSPTFPMVNTILPKSENLNGWLVEDDDHDATEPVKLTRTIKPSTIKRKHSDT